MKAIIDMWLRMSERIRRSISGALMGLGLGIIIASLKPLWESDNSGVQDMLSIIRVILPIVISISLFCGMYFGSSSNTRKEK